MKQLLALIVSLFLVISPGMVMASQGVVTGGKVYALPDWFKSSFLNFDEDIDEARAEGRHVMAFFHFDECPYCSRMLEENFYEGKTQEFMQANFDVIGVNVLGDLDVDWIDGNQYSEKSLAEHLGIRATPTMLFFDLDGAAVLALSGYRDPIAVQQSLDYVQQKKYRDMVYPDYLASLDREAVYEFRSHPAIQQATFLKDIEQPLLVLFEDSYCQYCDSFHAKTFNHPEVLDALEGYLVVRLDARSQTKVVTPDGKLTTARDWVRELGLTFRPSFLLYNGGEEYYRVNGAIYHHHMTEALLWTKSGHLEFPDIDTFKEVYRASRLARGKDVDFSE